MEPKDFLGLSGVPVVIGLTALTKPFLPDKRLWPVAAMLYAILWSLLLSVILHTDPINACAVGVITGLTANGLYSGVKTISNE